MVWPLNLNYSLTPNGGGSTTHHPANLARACPSLKKFFESSPTLLLTVCKVSSLNLKSKSFKRSMCKTDFHLFFNVFADSCFYRKNSEITFCVIISLKVPQPHFILSDIARDRDLCLIIALERHSEHFLNPYNRRV